jgi:hypothetical protein
MVILTAMYGSRFLIGHFSGEHRPGVTYTFDQTFLPDNITSHMRSLTGAGNHRYAIYPLTETQDSVAADIFTRLRGEAGSGYIFSRQLEQTYLVELIHFITRLKV